MKKIITSLLITSFSFLIVVSPFSVYAGAVLPNAFSTNKLDITITQAGASAKFQDELDKIPGLDARNAKLTFTVDKGVEGSASPVNVDILKIDNYYDNTSPFIGTTTGTMNISGTVYARSGKIGFNVGTVVPASLNMFHIENAIENVLNSYIGNSYIGSVDIKNTQIVAHIVDNPNPNITSKDVSSGVTNPGSSKLIPDCNLTGDTEIDGDQSYLKFRNPCNFDALLQLVNNVINFLLFYFATPLAAIIFAYAGFLFIFSSANEHNKSHAKAMIGKVLFGYVIALAAWLIINTILSLLLTDEAMKWTFLK